MEPKTVSDLEALRGLDGDIRGALLCQIRDLWTHRSTALEGNTLTLGETKFVIEEGLSARARRLRTTRRGSATPGPSG